MTYQSTFEKLREIAEYSRITGGEAPGRDALIRFLDTYGGNSPDLPIVDSLCARFGLYPYVSRLPFRDSGLVEAFALELHSPASLQEEGFAFHAEQQRVYEKLMEGQSLILSAPTSFGKSVIVDAVVASEQWSNIAIIVPTIALIDETRRRLSRFRGNYDIVTHPGEPFGPRNVIIMTQERFLELDELPSIDFFMIDEFYKLGSGRPNDLRRTMLNLAWNRLKATGAQYYLIGPNIDSLDVRLPEAMRDKLVRTDFQTVAVDVTDRSDVADQLSDVVDLVSNDLEGSTLVFTGSPKKAEGLALTLSGTRHASSQGFAFEVSRWIAENYDPEWALVTALRGGIGIHTGPLPRGLQRIMVRLFNEAMVPVLVCTSTLIEGVNTAARNVVIYEKKIDNQLIDFFTFSNIRGRAGRMFRHYVGNVVSYMPLPEASATVVDVPIETQSALASDATLIQLDAESLDDAARDRLSEAYDQDDLSIGTLRKNRGLDPALQIQAARKLAEMSDANFEIFTWRRAASSDQARATLKFAFDNLLEPHQRRGMNFRMLWGQLQNQRVNAESFSAQVDQQMRYARDGQNRSDVISDVLRFQRNWLGFTVPSMLRGLQHIQAEVARRRGVIAGNYEYLLREIEGMYLPEGLAQLEEYGLPLPLGVKLSRLGLRGPGIAELLSSFATIGADPHVVAQLSAVEQWIVEDVLDGLGYGR